MKKKIVDELTLIIDDGLTIVKISYDGEIKITNPESQNRVTVYDDELEWILDLSKNFKEFSDKYSVVSED